MPLVPILESKSQIGPIFLLKRLKFALSVKFGLMLLEGVPRVSSSIF